MWTTYDETDSFFCRHLSVMSGLILGLFVAICIGVMLL